MYDHQKGEYNSAELSIFGDLEETRKTKRELDRYGDGPAVLLEEKEFRQD